jgi:hypothetical protein
MELERLKFPLYGPPGIQPERGAPDFFGLAGRPITRRLSDLFW